MVTQLYETSRPCPQCGREVDLTNVKPGGQTFCRNPEVHERKQVLRRRKVAPAWRAEQAAAQAQAAEIAAAPVPEPVAAWAELPGILDWPGPLGPECPESPRCNVCACSSPPIRYTGDHTGTVCPECGPGCWDVARPAYDRGKAHATQAAAIAKVASSPAGQAKLDQRAREMRRTRDRLLRSIAAGLAAKRITDDSASDLRWFRDEVEQADTPGRLDQLAAELRGYTVEQQPWWRDTTAYLDPGDDEDQADNDDMPPGRELARVVPIDPAADYWNRYDRDGPAAVPLPGDDGDRSPGWITRRAGRL